jgi:hypothetical protein
MAEMWICGDCRSTNGAKDKRCYRCGVPRATAEMTEATAAAAVVTADQARTVLASATRLGARYRGTWPLAIVTVILIFVATAAEVLQTRDVIAHTGADGTVVMTVPELTSSATMGLIGAVAFLLGVLAWSFWIALVVANVPALTARWPTRSPVGAFFGQWIPILNIKRPFTTVRDVVVILAPSTATPALVVMGWWATFLASYFVPFIYVLLRVIGHEDATIGDSVRSGSQIGMYLEIVAAVLAACVVVIVEYHQHLALERRSQLVLGAETTAG